MQRTGFAIISLGAAALALAAPAGARTVGNWEVAPDDGTACSMSTMFEDNLSLALIWSPKTGVLSLMAASNQWSGMRDRADKPVNVEFKFSGGVKYDEWQDKGARVVTGSGQRTGVVANWGADLSDELGATVSGANGVTISIDGKGAGQYDLSGTGAAYQELMRCGSHLHPDD